MDKNEKTTQSIRVSPELWKEVKVHVAKTETNISSFIEQALKNELKKEK
jgi:post-segregation antitoxin (ccd killing protein)